MKRDKNTAYKFLLGLILLIGFVLRVWRLNEVPISLFGDEIDVGLQGYSIITTGKDYFGNSFPIMFRSFAEYRLPMQPYLAGVSINFLGLNEWGVRIPSAIFGVITVASLYVFVKEIFDKNIALIASFFLAISPWHLQFSRQANDSGFLLPFILFGSWLFIRGTIDYKKLLASAVVFSLSIYSYATASLFTPIYAFLLFLIYRKKVVAYGYKKLALVLAVVALVLSPYVYSSFDKTTTKRFSDITVASNKELVEEVIENRKWSDTLLSKVLYNRYTVLANKVGENYLISFSTPFLFLSGDPNPRHSISDFGQMYHFDLILIILGVMFFAKMWLVNKKIRPEILVVILWLLLSPLSSSLTKNGGTHAARLLLMLPPLIIVSAAGVSFIQKKSKRFYSKILVVIFLAFVLFDITKYFQKYYMIWPNQSWRFWQDGYEEVINYVEEIDNSYSRVYFNNTYEPMLPRFLFWYGYDMNLFQKQFTDDKHIKNLVPGFNGFQLGDKYYFGEIEKPVENLVSRGNLIVASAQDDVTNEEILYKRPIKLLKTVYSQVNTPIFYVFTASE
ncbi:MAG: ArnT family glycosyltransferase [Patescibacteria group bacterium]